MRYECFVPDVPPTEPVLSGFRGRPLVRTPYNYDVRKASLESALACPEGTRTQQQYAEECDINNIAKNFGITGRLPENVRMPTFEDFSDVVDYQSALNAARRASQSFMQMPAEVRERFANSPQKFLEFCSNDSNREEAAKLGLVAGPKVSASVPPPADPPKPM